MISILIPARNEPYLEQTIDDVLKHAKGEIEILVGLDGCDQKINNPKVKGIAYSNPIGQRAMTNVLADLAHGKYLMKLDGHCSLSKGFDLAIIAEMDENTVVVPALATLDVKNWTVPSQPINSNFLLDTNLIFQYGPNIPKLVHETMTIQGSGFLCSKKKYFELNLCDESLGSWGMQGTEVSLKTWLSGGRVISTKNAYMGHWFRTKEEGGPGFPYERNMEEVRLVFRTLKELFLTNSWPKQTRSIQSLIKQFDFPLDWSPKKVDELCTPFHKML